MTKEEIINLTSDELIHKGNLDIINSHFSANYMAHAGDKKYEGHDFLRRWTKQIHAAIGNIKVAQILVLAQTDQTITWQRTLTGIHQENLRGIPASGKKIKWNEMVVSQIIDDKISEEWIVSELAGELMLKLPKK